MEKEIIKYTSQIYSAISALIDKCKHSVLHKVNNEMVLLYWNIGKYLVCTVLNENKAEYGQKIVEELSVKLSLNYGKGFEKTSLFRMIKFYREFPDIEKVATLSQQLTWSHFVELLPIEDEVKRNFYAIMCCNENWNVRTLRERRKSMLFERTAISKKPDITIKNDLLLLQAENKMSPDLFYRDPYILDFLGLKDTYSEKYLENSILAEQKKIVSRAEKSQQTIELLELDKGNIRVGQYLTKMPPKDVLEQKLLQAIENAKAKGAN